jgi:hypothetical protein
MFAPDATAESADLDARVERCRRVVDTLIEVGMKLVRTLDPERGPAPVRDPFQAYCRISRALRLTLLIEARLAALAEGGGPAVAAERGLAGTSVEGSQGEPLEEPEAEAAGEAAEAAGRAGGERDREAPDEISRFLSRPMGEIVAMVCRDFDLPQAEADEAQAAFAELTANDDAGEPDRIDPDLGAPGDAGRRDLRRRVAQRAGPGLGPWSLAP